MSPALKSVFKEIGKKYGEGAIPLFGNEVENIEVWDTGCFSLNYILGNGGIAKGRVYELFGQPSSGKSTAALYLISQIQKMGGKAAYIDAEFSLNTNHAKNIGVDLEDLIISKPRTGEIAFNVIEGLIKTDEIDIIVVDSTAALVPEKEMQGDIADSTVALQARMMAKGLRKLTGAIAQTKTIVIFISQVRAKIGMYGGHATEASGGNAIKFYSSVRLEVRRLKMIEENGKMIGNRLKITAVKNKVSAPNGSMEVDLYYNSGFDLVGDLLDYGEKKEVVQKNGRTYIFGDEKIGVGREQAKLRLTSDRTLYEDIRKAINEAEERSEETFGKETEKDSEEASEAGSEESSSEES